MAGELTRTETLVRDLARGNVALMLLEELSDAADGHDSRMHAVHADFRQKWHDANDSFVSRVMAAVRKCNDALSEFDVALATDTPNADD